MPGISRRLLAAAVMPAAVAAVVLAGSGIAGASTGTAEISPEQAGYTATGAQFRDVDAVVYLRNPSSTPARSPASATACSSGPPAWW